MLCKYKLLHLGVTLLWNLLGAMQKDSKHQSFGWNGAHTQPQSDEINVSNFNVKLCLTLVIISLL